MSTELRRRSVRILLDKVAAVRYPSPTLLDRVEGALTTQEDTEEYIGLLLDTIERERFPSPMFVERALRLVETLESAAP
ncbi:MAG TPA: hypothetical protein VFN60_08775 [Acidimicrobiales bacterium]|nr:hypothetical protein [Acidimicrobiales bacterium]